MSRLKLFLLILFFAMLAPRVYQIIKMLDIGETVVPHSPGKCHKIKGINQFGSEDIDLIPDTDTFLISSGLIFGALTKFQDERKGQILFYDMSEKGGEAKAATFKNYKDEKQMNPHGISVWKDRKGGKVILFVVNHHKTSTEMVERFDVDIKTHTLTYIESITDPEFKALNDITAVGEREFYFTNSGGYRMDTMMSKVEGYLGLRLCTLGHYDGKEVKVFDSGLAIANGINTSPDKRYLYVAHIGESEIRTYDIQTRNSPKLVQTMPVPTIVDNISVDPKTGDLWLGCHPVGWQIMHYLENQDTAIAPSQVLKVTTKDGLLTEDFVEVYVDDGKVISASSVAVYHKGQLVIGSISHDAVQCRVQSF